MSYNRSAKFNHFEAHGLFDIFEHNIDRCPMAQGHATSIKVCITQFIIAIRDLLNHKPYQHNKSGDNPYGSTFLW